MAKRLKRPIWLQKITSLLQQKKVYRKNKPAKMDNHHNLKEIFNEINSEYFSSSLNLDIGWSGKGSTSSRTSIRLGYYNLRTQRIKINRLLDSPQIPKYFVSFILYHEILHHVYPPVCPIGSRRKIHHSLFKEKEKEFHGYMEAQNFLKELKKELFVSKTSRNTA